MTDKKRIVAYVGDGNAYYLKMHYNSASSLVDKAVTISRSDVAALSLKELDRQLPGLIEKYGTDTTVAEAMSKEVKAWRS